MGKKKESKEENFNIICKNIIFNYISEYVKEKQSVKNNTEQIKVLVEKYTKKLKLGFNNSDRKIFRYTDILFFSSILLGCYEYFEKYFKENMLNTLDENSHLILKYKNILQSFKTISFVIQSNDFYNSLILFRALYENMVILKFLLNNPDCIGEFDESSMIKSAKLYDIYGKKLNIIKTEKIKSENDKETYKISNLDIEEELKIYYNWAKKKIKKTGGISNSMI